MKTLIHAETKVSRFVFNDEEDIVLAEAMAHTPHFNIGDLNSTNATLIENVTPPEDWAGCKYLYDAGAWTLNPNWKDPE